MTTTRVPLTAFAPVHPPLAVQLVASVADQLRVSQEPGKAGCHMRLIAIAGGGMALTVTVAIAGGVSPGPAQASV